jgi:hypothetical protein
MTAGSAVSADVPLLKSFADLASASDDAIRVFASERGLLYICRRHKRVATHADPPCGLGLGVRAPKTWTEPVESWRELAGRITAALALAEALGRGGDWRPAARVLWRPMAAGITTDDTARDLLRRMLSLMLRIARIQPILRWRPDGSAEVTLGAGPFPGLYGAIVGQLLLAIAGGAALAVCSNCARAYEPSRRPRLGQRHYCPDCRQSNVPQRDASRDWYRRNRARLASAGPPPSD